MGSKSKSILHFLQFIRSQGFELKALNLWRSPRPHTPSIRVHRPKGQNTTQIHSELRAAESSLNSRTLTLAVIAGLSGGAILLLFSGQLSHARGFLSSKPESEKRKLTAREKRFIKFASVEYEGQIFMTPQDFLESAVEGEPRPRLKRKGLSPREVDFYMSRIPKISKNDDHFLRHLGHQGIISFSEYLFLLTILIKPQSGFKIAFAMLDQDGNGRIDKDEFRVLERVFSSAARERKAITVPSTKEQLQDASTTSDSDDAIFKIHSDAKVATGEFDDSDHGLHRARKVDTTLLVYFFGRKGSDELKFDDFHRFMENLQTEVLEMEFQEFSKGAQFITELDFARILLRYTYLNSEEYETILERLVQRLHQDEKGISFDEFRDFCLFLNNLDDFQIAMKMYTLADKPISQDEFSRAVSICTGRKLSNHLVHTVFQIFDDDGDGLLSYQEFIVMMKERTNRGLKAFSRQEGWSGFKKCVKQEVKSTSN